MNEKNLIQGTQLILNNQNIYYLRNANEESELRNPLFQKQGHKIYRDKFDASY